TDGVGARKRPVHERIIGRFVQPLPVFDVDAVDEQVGVERRRRDEREHLSGTRLYGHQRATPAFELGLDGLLQMNVERQAQVRSRHGVDAAQRAHRAPRSGDFHLLHTGTPMQNLFPGFLDALLADDLRAAIITDIALFLELLQVGFRYATHIAQYVCRRFAVRVLAHPSGAELHTWKTPGVRGKP